MDTSVRGLQRRTLALAAAIVGVGVALRSVQYFSQSSLWIDEAALARNIVDGSFLRLLGPLDYAQVAPPGFLWLERATVLALGPSELSLRLWPFAASLAGLVLFTILAFRVLPEAAAALASWLFAVAVPMVFFGADVKPYSADVAASLAIALAASRASSEPSSPRWAVRLGLLGVLAWFSHIVPFVLAGTGIALVLFALHRGRIRVRHLGIVALIWAVVAGPAVALALHNVVPEDAAYLQRAWERAFMPHAPRPAARWMWDTLLDVLGRPGSWELNGALHYGAPLLFVPLLLLGAWYLWRQHREAGLVLLMPAVVALAASWASLYPFAGRFVLFLLPALLLTIAAGIVQAARVTRSRWVGVLLAVLVGVVSARAAVRTPPPQRPEDLRPVLETIARSRHPGDATYVYYGARQAFLYYRTMAGFESGSYVIGRCSRYHADWMIREVEQLRSFGRVWIVASHSTNQAQEISSLITHLRATGRELDHVLPPDGDDAEAYLFALNPPVGAVGTGSDVFPGTPSWECGGPAGESAAR